MSFGGESNFNVALCGIEPGLDSFRGRDVLEVHSFDDIGFANSAGVNGSDDLGRQVSILILQFGEDGFFYDSIKFIRGPRE